MNLVLRNILAVITGLVIGSIVNMLLIMLSGSVIPPPQGADVTTMAGLKASMHLFEPKHFIFPFLAHAMGSLSGAWIAAKIVRVNPLRPALVVGLFFLAGGITNILLLPSPLWFSLLDGIGAYLPMAWLGAVLGTVKQPAE